LLLLKKRYARLQRVKEHNCKICTKKARTQCSVKKKGKGLLRPERDSRSGATGSRRFAESNTGARKNLAPRQRPGMRGNRHQICRGKRTERPEKKKNSSSPGRTLSPTRKGVPTTLRIGKETRIAKRGGRVGIREQTLSACYKGIRLQKGFTKVGQKKRLLLRTNQEH